MNKVSQILGLGKIFVTNNAHNIFFGLGVVGFGATVVSACKAAPKIEQQCAELDLTGERKTDILQIARASLPIAAPTIGLGVVSIGCFYASNHIVTKRNAVLAAAASLSERALLEYQEQVIKKLGEAAHDDILEAVADAGMKEGAVFDPSNFMEGDGDTLCYDKVTGRYFMSTPTKIREAENAIVKQSIDEVYVKLNDFYYELGLDDVSLIGEAVGWDISKVKPDIKFSSMLDEDKRPCLVLNYHVCMLNRNVLERVY